MIENERSPSTAEDEALWLKWIAEIDLKQERLLDLRLDGDITPEQFRVRATELKDVRVAAQGQLEASRSRLSRLTDLERSKDALVSHYASLVPVELDELLPADKHKIYEIMLLRVFAHPDDTLIAEWLFVFPDGLKDFVVPTNNLVDNFFAGLEDNLPSERFLPLWGGGANANFNMASPPYQYCDDEVITDGVSYALLSGKARAGWAVSHACIPIGGERIVTRAQGNIIYEIDNKPTLEVFEEYVPENALTDDRDWMRYAISLSLCFKAPSYMKDEEYVVRGMPAVSMADGSITVQTEVPEGTSVWLSSRDKEKISTGFDRMVAQIKEQLGAEKPNLVFQFECGTRGKMMFRDQEKLHLLKRFRQSLDLDAPWVGFYTVGEIGPVEEHNLRHLYTSVVLALS
jgi:hypothetical protein